MTEPERRLTPLPPSEWPEGMGAALKALNPPNPRHPFPPRDASRPKGLNVLGMLAHHPELTTAYHTFNGHLLFATTLEPRQRELLVLRVGHLRDAPYEFAQHVVIAGDLGITPEQIERIKHAPDHPDWSPLDAALLAAVDELVTDARIGDATFAALRAELDTKQLLDVIFTVGAYDLLAMAMRSFDLELDEDLRPFA